MHSVHAFLRQALWLSACIVPIPAGAFAMQTANMLLVSLLLFTALGTLVPFLYFGAQRTGYGAACGKLRCAAHLECALSVFAVMWFSVWAEAANGSSLETGLGIAGSAAAGAAAMVVVMVLIFAMDALAMRVYGRLKEMREGVRQWLTLAFLTGWIPGVLLLTAGIFAAAGIGSTFLFVLFLAGGMTWLLYLKVLLGMMSFAFYLYFSLEGPRFLRTIQVIFSAALWLLLLYAPLVASVQIPGYGAWRTWADPAYLSIIPFLSDLWAVGLACLGGRKITRWIGDAAE